MMPFKERTLWLIDHDSTQKTYHVETDGTLIGSFDNHGATRAEKSGQGITIKKSNGHIYSLQINGQNVKHYDENGVFIEQWVVFGLIGGVN